MKFSWQLNLSIFKNNTLQNSIIFMNLENLKTFLHVQYRLSFLWHQFFAKDTLISVCKNMKFIFRYHWLRMQLVDVDNMNKYDKDVILTVFQVQKHYFKKYHACLLLYLHWTKFTVHCKINKQVNWYTVLYYVNWMTKHNMTAVNSKRALFALERKTINIKLLNHSKMNIILKFCVSNMFYT